MSNPRILPKRLNQKDPVVIVAPASPFKEENLIKGKEVLNFAGWLPKDGQHLFENKSYLAGSDKSRAFDLNQAFADSSIRGIFCARGGYGSLRTLPFLKIDPILNDPKPFIGFSDNTALSMYLLHSCGLVTFSGPVAAGEQIYKMPKDHLSHMISMLSNPDYRGPVPGQGRCLVPGNSSGPLIGGNLTLLVHCLAAGILPSLDHAILLIEDVNEAPYRIDRAFTSLRLSGVLDSISGVLAGGFIGVDDDIMDEILIDLFGDLNIPIIAGFPVGHGEMNVSLPIGTNMTLDADNGVLKMEEGAVC